MRYWVSYRVLQSTMSSRRINCSLLVGIWRQRGKERVVGSCGEARSDRKQDHSKPIRQCSLHGGMGYGCLHESTVLIWPTFWRCFKCCVLSFYASVLYPMPPMHLQQWSDDNGQFCDNNLRLEQDFPRIHSQWAHVSRPATLTLIYTLRFICVIFWEEGAVLSPTIFQ